MDKSESYKKWYLLNRDKVLARKKLYREERKDELNRQTSQWHKTNPEKSLVVTAKARAKKLNLPFDLSPEDIVFPKLCPVLGIPLITKAGKRTSNTPSLDRLIPEEGYVKNNIRIISWRANRLKCDASLAELKALVKYMENNT